jgi:hypothetical protein
MKQSKRLEKHSTTIMSRSNLQKRWVRHEKVNNTNLRYWISKIQMHITTVIMNLRKCKEIGA